MTQRGLSFLADWHSAARSRGGAARDEVLRRTALAREPGPEGVQGPKSRLMLGELASLAIWRRERPDVPPAISPQPVMLLPGFGSHPVRMRPLARTLGAAGHNVIDWGLGFNFGPTPENFSQLLAAIDRFARDCDEPVTLVGWSLGGLFAREAAKLRAHHVRRVITMGTPFSGDPRANNAWRAYQLVTGHRVDEPPVPGEFQVKPPVPTIALWSPRDGIVAPRAACGWPGERDRAVALRCTHLGFAGDPRVAAEVLRQLDRDD